jgi:hypothetical protein
MNFYGFRDNNFFTEQIVSLASKPNMEDYVTEFISPATGWYSHTRRNRVLLSSHFTSRWFTVEVL